MSVKKYKGTKGSVDRLFSEVIRSVGYCENCFSTPPNVQLQCAHIISRRFNVTRADLRNATALCASCHRYYTDHPVDFGRFIQRIWAKDFYDDLLVKRRSMSKVDWNERMEFLTKVRDDLNGGTLTLTDARKLES